MSETENELSPRERDREVLSPLNIIRAETVLSKLPIHNLAKKGRVNIEITKKNDKGEIELKWDVSHNEKYGQPRQLGYKFDTLVVSRRIYEEGRPIPKLIKLGSLNEISKKLGSQKNELKKAIQQDATTSINAKLTYKGYDGSERYLEALFTRYSVIFTGERLPNGKKANSVFLVLNDPYWEVLNNAPFRPLNYDYLEGLPPASHRFYEILSYKIFTTLKYNHPYAKLLYSEYCTQAPQTRYYDYDHFKKQMNKVYEPHYKSGYRKNFRKMYRLALFRRVGGQLSIDFKSLIGSEHGPQQVRGRFRKLLRGGELKAKRNKNPKIFRNPKVWCPT